MPLSYPYTREFFADVMCYGDFTPALRRFDERSGGGDGRVWQAQLARPLWSVQAALSPVLWAQAREVNAKIAGLDGMAQSFRFSPPHYAGPAGGVSTGLSSVTVSAISAGRNAISLSGLPAGLAILAGDYLSINFAGRAYFGQFCEPVTANGSGNAASTEVRPYIPLGISAGAAVSMVRPAFIGRLESFTPYGDRLGGYSTGAVISILQVP